jgi:hypothetical protein
MRRKTLETSVRHMFNERLNVVPVDYEVEWH